MQYKDVKPCIIVEKYLGTESGELPVDYKFYCMNGKASSVRLDALHDTLNRTLAEVVAVALHSQAVNADSHRFFLFLVVLVVLVIAVVASQLQDTISDKVFTSSITFDNRLD